MADSADRVSGHVSFSLEHPADFPLWRSQARLCLAQHILPENISWRVESAHADLFDSTSIKVVAEQYPNSEKGTATTVRVPAAFVSLAEQVICHSNEQRFGLLYRVLWRLTHGETHLMSRCTDDDIHALNHMASAVRRDQHKMKAFVRFRQYRVNDVDYYHAFFEPDHTILRATAGFFCRRFTNMLWSISTPEECAHWDGQTLEFGPAVPAQALPDAENMDDLWLTYFESIFNPARLKLNAMRSEMPVKYWKNLPESSLISQLSHGAGQRSQQMIDSGPTLPSRYSRRPTHKYSRRTP